jgi:enoyl-CoA hydratase
MYENIILDRRERVAVLTINRPDKLNALNVATRDDIDAALDEIRADDAIRVLVVTGAGEKAFIAGADITEFAGRTAHQQRAAMQAMRVFNQIEEFPKPVIAAINGFCLGGGCELALACDLRIASERAKLGQPEINLGIIPGGGGTQRLTRLVGEGKAMELILTGKIISAQEALAIGLVNEVVSPEALDDRVMELAAQMTHKSPIALQAAKEAVKTAARTNLREGLDREIDLFTLCFASEDKEEGVRAFIEKRKPEFKGR